MSQKESTGKRPPNTKLRHAREVRGWSQKDVSDKLSIADYRTVRRWEKGDVLPTPYYRQQLCELFGMNAVELGFVGDTQAIADDEVPTTPVRDTEDMPPAGPILVSRNPNRDRLLAKVYSFWIEGVLKQSVHREVMITLGLQKLPEAVENPWHLILQLPDQSQHTLQPEISLLNVYDQVQGELILLGEPGSGKTTLLLELAQHLIQRARNDETQPMPVIFNLSSWTLQKTSLNEWLVEELNIKYQVPRTLGQKWVQDDQILPLLDGLNEVLVSCHEPYPSGDKRGGGDRASESHH